MATELDSTLTEAWYDLGNVLGRRGEIFEAEQCYGKAIACDPRFGMAHFGLACLFMNSGKNSAAEAALRKAIDCDCGNSMFYTNLGNIMERRGDLPAAIAQHRLAAACERSALTHSNLGEAQCWLADWPAAEQNLRKAVELEPDFVFAQRYLGWLLYMRGDLDGAETHYRKAGQLDPKDGESNGMLGRTLERQGDLVGAEANYLEAVRRSPDKAAFIFEADRLQARPRTAGELYLVLAETLAKHRKWSDRQRRDVLSAAAVAAARYARPFAPGALHCDRAEFRLLALELFATVARERSAALTTAPETASEQVASTASWLADVELAHVRNPFSLLVLPAEERGEWLRFWASVDAIREKCLR